VTLKVNNAGLYFLTEYLSLGRQLDDLDQALDLLVEKNDHLTKKAKEFLKETKAARDPASTGGTPAEPGMGLTTREKEETASGTDKDSSAQNADRDES
jgi:hypothetical protein